MTARTRNPIANGLLDGAAPHAAPSAAPASPPAPSAPSRRGRSAGRVRKASAGDVIVGATAAAIEAATVDDRVQARHGALEAAVRDLVSARSQGDVAALAGALEAVLAGVSADDAQWLRRTLKLPAGDGAPAGESPDEELADDWREGGYPYRNLMQRRNYEKTKYRLQVELLKLQAWVKETGQRVVILFEGRDAAGKGGTIKRFMEHLNPRGARVVALEKPTDQERGQWYFQRYVEHLPTRGEIVMFDRSWYNRAGVERVMGFCSDTEYDEFMRQAPDFERNLVRSGIHLIKFWFSVSRKEQASPIQASARMHPLKQWKLSPIDKASLDKWDDYTKRQGDHVLRDRHCRFALDGHQERLQEACAPERDALRAAQAALRQQGPADRRQRRSAAGGPRARGVRARREAAQSAALIAAGTGRPALR